MKKLLPLLLLCAACDSSPNPASSGTGAPTPTPSGSGVYQPLTPGTQDPKAETGPPPTSGYKLRQAATDRPTAERIALLAWIDAYGENVRRDTPFVFVETDSSWIGHGTLPKNMKGGVPEIEIAKKNGRIIRITHGK